MFDRYFSVSFMDGLQNLVIAILVLIIGWIIAKVIANTVEKALKKTSIDEKLVNKFRVDQGEKKIDANKIISKVVYYILLLIVFILFFNVLSLDMIANPLSNLISTFLSVIPAVLKAILILALAWILATAVRWLIIEGSKKINLQQFLRKIKVANTEEQVSNIPQTLGKIAFYLILLLFIPAVLNALSISGVAEPFSGLLATILAFIPKFIAAAIIFAVGWFVAKIVKDIVTNLLLAVGTEKLVKQLKLDKVFEGTSLSAFVGNLVFILIMIPVTITSLEQLELTGITEPAISMLNKAITMIPNILIAIALVLIGIWLGKLIGDFARDYLGRLGFDRFVAKASNKSFAANKLTPSDVVGYVVQFVIVFFLVIQALNVVQLDFLVGVATAITAYLPQVLAAVLILGVAFILGNVVDKVLRNILAGPSANVLASFAKYAIIALSVFMALTQLGIAPSIVNAAFILILGGLSLAFGLAFGLGGKDFAAKYLRKFEHTIDETSVKEKKPEPKINNNGINSNVSKEEKNIQRSLENGKLEN
ncbi:hypothetical protein CUC15_13235 [Oceanobacillus zhaokaii]|uniref:Uncharacterized protein n=2 Tax=Oceanobacillus zhaokaii TaxID=2052660 RepID=A0A345PME4_9BACI|nr:hypothetical protein CUC15_13235 [Oceanobacillus zhaokaii]